MVEEQLKSLQQEMDEEEQRERERTEQSILVLREEKSKILAERKQKIQEKASLLVGDEEEHKKLIKSHDENTQRLVNKIDAERLRMEADLHERLRKKREAKYKAKESEMQEELLKKRKQMEESNRQKRQDLAKEEKEKLEQLQKSLPYELSSAGPQAEDNSTQSNSTAPISRALPLKQQELTMLLLSSPLYKKIDEIAILLQNQPLGSNHSPYIDSKDALWVNDTEFHTVSTSSISPKAFVVYKFGCCIIKSLSTHCSHDPVFLLIADKIPPNRHIQQNAFCNSFMFDTKNRILYVRLERLENVGEFVLVLVHTLAHIQVGNFNNDTDPNFVKEFYRCLSICCNDLFLSRYHDSSLRLNERDDSEIVAGSKVKMLTGDLLDARLMVDTDSQGTTNKRHMYKLQRYSEFKFGSKLRAFLDQIDEERQCDSDYSDQIHASPPGAPNQVLAVTTKSSDQEVTTAKAATRSLNKASYWKTVAKRVMHKPSNPYQHILEAQTRDLQERVQKLNVEYMQVTKERNDINAEVENLEQLLADNQHKLKTVNENEFEAQKQIVKNTALKLSAARTEQATYDLRVNGCLKRLEGFQAQLVQKQRMLEESCI